MPGVFFKPTFVLSNLDQWRSFSSELLLLLGTWKTIIIAECRTFWVAEENKSTFLLFLLLTVQAQPEKKLCFDFLPYFETQNFVEGNSSFRRGNIGLVQGNKPLVSPLLPCCPAQRCTRSRNGRSRCRKCKFRRETPWIKPQPRLCNELKKIIICLYYPITYYPITYYHITYYPQGIFLCTISAISQ